MYMCVYTDFGGHATTCLPAFQIHVSASDHDRVFDCGNLKQISAEEAEQN